MSQTGTSAAGPAAALLQKHGESLTGYLRQWLARHPQAPPKLMEAVEYSLMAGGKRLRPALVLECCNACTGGPPVERRGHADRAAERSALAGAAAMELIHTFSLVHDDLPAMDDDDLRRGRPTNHKVFGEAMAILAGDAMVTMAFQVLAADAGAAVAGPMVAELAAASGPEGMIGGQVLDMEGENQRLSIEELRRLHRMKTGALLVASCRLGAMAAGANAMLVERVGEYGRHLGLAFQIVDDLLDVTASPQQLGKATGKDKAKGKNTYPDLIGLEGSRRAAQDQLSAALQAVAPLGEAGAGLASLARFVVEREL